MTREEALRRMSLSLETAKQAKKRKIDVREARRLLRQGRDAFERGDYPAAAWFADRIIERLGRAAPPVR